MVNSEDDMSEILPVEWSPPFLAPPVQGPLIGRDGLMRQLKGRLFVDSNHPVIVLTQLPGVGKTAMVIHLANDEEVIQHFSDGVLWVPLGQSPDVQALLGEWMLALGFTTQEVSDTRTTLERKAAITQKIGDRAMLLVLDDAWELESALEFLIGGQNCSRIVTTRLMNVATDLPGAEIIAVPELDQENGLALLENLAPRAVKAETKQALDLVHAVGGSPLALVLMGKYLWKESFSGQPHRIQAALSKLKDAEKRLSLEQAGTLLSDVSPSVMSSIQVSEEVLDEASRQVLLKLSIFQAKPQTFTNEAAKTIAGANEEHLDILLNAGLLESVPNKGYWMPRTIADYMRSKLDPEDRETLHHEAADYFMTLLRQYEMERSGDATPYQRMYSYEDTRWQAFKTPYTYHQEKLLNRTDANLIHAEVYFDTFWWWRCYNENFPFNDKLLELWRESAKMPEDKKWLSEVQKFQRAYPTSYIKRGRGDWDTVEKSLLAMRELGGMQGDIFELDLHRRHLRAITNMFLAESYRYRSLADQRADEHYQESLKVFQRGTEWEDSWNLPWTLWHLSDLAVERGQNKEARNFTKEARAAAKSATKEPCGWDNEVISNTYRVDADSYWQEGDLEQALRNYTRTVYYAYMFQSCPMQLPDFYTVDFYHEMITRTLDRIFALTHQDRVAEGVNWVKRLNAFWKPYWNLVDQHTEISNIETLLVEGRRKELAEYISPPAPTKQDMNSPETIYAQKVRRILDILWQRMDQEQEF